MKWPGGGSACISPTRAGELKVNSSSSAHAESRSCLVPLLMIADRRRPSIHSETITFGALAITAGTQNFGSPAYALAKAR
nr:hypothetical protein CPGR_00776 [Mycolicibacter nonchromogenicus]